MIILRIVHIYSLGWNLRLLNESLTTDSSHSLYGILYILETTSIHLKGLELLKTTSMEIGKIIEEYSNSYFIGQTLNFKKYEHKESDRELEDFDKAKLLEKFKIWDDRIDQVLQKTQILKLESKGNLDSTKLLNGIESFIEDKKIKKLPLIIIDDLKDCIICLQTGAWTPAAMIAMRAIESAIRVYYKTVKKADPTGKPWGTILAEIKAEKNINLTLIKYLDYLKDIRNSIQHPNERFSSFDAEQAFLHAIKILDIIFT